MSKWEMVRLGDICEITAGQGAPQGANKFCNIGIPFIKAGNLAELVNDGTEDGIQQVTEETIQEYKLKIFPKSTIVFAKSGMSCLKGYVYELKKSSCVVNHLACVIPKSIFSTYLKYFFMLNPPNRLIKDRSYPSIRLEDISNIKVSLPNLKTQKKIAMTLDSAIELINLRKQRLVELDNLIKSVFYDMFGDPITNPMGWEAKRLCEYIEFLTSGSRGWSSYFANDGEMFITIKNVKNRTIITDNMQYVHAPDTKEAERTRVKTGDLLISITADLGRTGVIESEIAEYGAYINQHLCLVRLDQTRLNPCYVSHYLETDAGKIQFESKNQVGVKAGLNFNAINSLIILVPPISKQNQYINFVRAAQEAKSEARKSIKESQLLFNSLMSQYFE